MPERHVCGVIKAPRLRDELVHALTGGLAWGVNTTMLSVSQKVHVIDTSILQDGIYYLSPISHEDMCLSLP